MRFQCLGKLDNGFFSLPPAKPVNVIIFDEVREKSGMGATD